MTAGWFGGLVAERYICFACRGINKSCLLLHDMNAQQAQRAHMLSFFAGKSLRIWEAEPFPVNRTCRKRRNSFPFKSCRDRAAASIFFPWCINLAKRSKRKCLERASIMMTTSRVFVAEASHFLHMSVTNNFIWAHCATAYTHTPPDLIKRRGVVMRCMFGTCHCGRQSVGNQRHAAKCKARRGNGRISCWG